MTRQFNVRLPLRTQQQINEICDSTGYTVTQCVIVAIDAMSQRLATEQAAEAERQAAISTAAAPVAVSD